MQSTVPMAPVPAGVWRRPQRQTVLVVLSIVVCGLARIWYLASSRVQFNADEATTGIMVRQIMHGHLYTFFAGQDYGGALEQYLQAGMYLVLRLPQDPFTLRLVQVALSMTTCGFVYLVARRVLSTGSQAVVAAFVYAVSPWYNVVGSATSLGFYVAGQLLPLIAIYCMLRLSGSRRDVWWSIVAGLCWGLAVWTTVATIYFLVPALIWLVPVAWRRARIAGGMLAGFLVGGLPLFGWLVGHHILPVPPAQIKDSTPLERVGNLFDPVLREYIGVAYPHARGGLLFALQVAVLAGLLAWYAVGLWLRRRGLGNVLLLRSEGRIPADLLLLVPFMVVIAYAASNATWYTGTPRYLYSTYPLFAIALGATARRWRVGRRVPQAAIIGMVVVVGSAALAWGGVRDLSATPSVAQQSRVFREVADYLHAQDEDYVYANYWTAMPLQYAAVDRITVAVCKGSRRLPANQVAVAAHRPPVFVTSPLDGASDPIGRALRNHHIAYRATTIGFATIYDQLPADVTPRGIGLVG